MNILFVSNGFPPTAFGGVEVHTHSLAHSFRRRGYKVTVFCRESSADLPDYHEIHETVEGIDVIRIVNDYKEISSFSATYQDHEIDRIFRTLLEQIKPDLVHFNHWIALSANLPLITHTLRIPSVTFLHDYWVMCHRVHLMDWRGDRCPGPAQGGDCYRCVVSPEKRRAWVKTGRRWAGRILRFALRKHLRQRLLRDPGRIIAFNTHPEDFDHRGKAFRDNLRHTQRVFAPSNFVRNIFIQNGFQDFEIDVLPLGIDTQPLSDFRTSFPDQIRLAFIGTLVPTKGAHVLLRALNEVSAENLGLGIHGRQDADPGYFRKLLKLARGDNRIRFEGSFPIGERAKIFGNADLIIIPSLVHETFSLVAREALSLGKPIIAANVGALPEIVVHGENGFLFPAGDHHALASLLNEVANEPKMLMDLDLPGPTPLVSEEEHVDALERIYKEIRSEG